MLLEGRLFRGCVALEPAFKALGGVFREGAVLVDGHGRVQDRLGRAEAGHAVDERGERTGERAHEIGAGEDPVAELGLGLGILDAGGLDDVGDIHAGRAGDLAALAVEAVFQRFIEEVRVFQAEAFPVRTGLFRAGIAGIGRNDRAIGGTDRALHALFEVVGACSVFL